MTCDGRTREGIERLAHGDVPAAEREALERHVASCAACRAALDDLRIIEREMHGRGAVSAPPGGDWTAFMARLDRRLDEADGRRDEPGHGRSTVGAAVSRPGIDEPRPHVVPRSWALALAATLVIGLALGAWWTRGRQPATPAPAVALGSSPAVVIVPQEVAVSAVTAQHLERTKLVLLGLLDKDATDPHADWSYERKLAGDLLPDTSLYRLAAQRQPLPGLARVLRDVELVMLQASLGDEADAATLARLQRVIRTRDLIVKVQEVQQVQRGSGVQAVQGFVRTRG